MRILWLSHFVPFPPAGGALQRSYHLLRHAARSHDVHVLALNQPRLLPTTERLSEAVDALSRFCASIRVFPLASERSAIHRLTTVARSVAGPEPYDVTWLRSSAMQSAVTTWHDGPEDIDLLHVDTVGLWPYADQWTRGSIVLGHHNVESDLIARRCAQETSAWRSALLRRDAAKLRTIEAHAGQRAAVNLLVSKLDADRFVAVAPGANIEVVENGVDTDYWQPREPARDSGRIVFAGTLGWYPNRNAVEFLLADVWPLLATTRSDRQLVLVGRDPPAVARAAAAKDARIEVTGYVPDVRPYLENASVCVCPIRVGGGTRLKVLDALAMAKPVVATAVAVEGLDLVDGKHYLRAESAGDFVAQIVRLEQQPELRRELGAAGRQRAIERFDWTVIGRQLDAAYSRATSDRHLARGAGV